MAGRATDAVVAYLLGWRWDEKTATSPTGSRWARVDDWGKLIPDETWLPSYSTDISLALEATKEIELDVIRIRYNHPHIEPVTVFLKLADGREVAGDGDSEAHAMCLAFIAATPYEPKDIDDLWKAMSER
jgi:hypothetical protein